LVIASALAVFGIRTWEQPRYEVLLREQRQEIRRYEPYLVATVVVDGQFEQAQDAAFRILADYIFGANGSGTAIAMTAPVIQAPAKGERLAMTAPVFWRAEGAAWSMAFVLPSRNNPDTVPRPTDPRIELQEVPAEVVAAVRFSGRADRETLTRLDGELRSWIRARTCYEPVGDSRFAAYDPPFTIPFLRRNELLIPVVPEAPTRPPAP
jgi:hypothetical protein